MTNGPAPLQQRDAYWQGRIDLMQKIHLKEIQLTKAQTLRQVINLLIGVANSYEKYYGD
jgi:hypothetical protein